MWNWGGGGEGKTGHTGGGGGEGAGLGQPLGTGGEGDVGRGIDDVVSVATTRCLTGMLLIVLSNTADVSSTCDNPLQR